MLDDLIKTLVEESKRMRANTALWSARGAKKYENCDLFVIVAHRGADKFDIVQTLVNSLADTEDNEPRAVLLACNRCGIEFEDDGTTSLCGECFEELR